MIAVADPGLGLPTYDGEPGALDGAGASVVRAGRAGAGSFLVEGAKISVFGSERDGIDAARIGDVVACGPIRSDAGRGVNVVVGPSSIRRELIGATSSWIETVLAAPTLPLMVAQWSQAAATPMSAKLEVAATVLPGAERVRYCLGGRGLRAADDDRPGHVVEMAVHPPTADWTIDPTEGGGLRVRAAVRASARVTLLLTAGTEAVVRGVWAAAGRLDAGRIQAAALFDPMHTGGLVLSSGVPDLDEGVAWATLRLRASLERTGLAAPAGTQRPDPSSARAALWSGLGSLAVGDDVSAGRALALLEALGEAEAEVGLGGALPAVAFAALLAARATLLSGDAGPALEHARALVEPRKTGAAIHSAAARDLEALTLQSLADALRFAAPEREIRALRERGVDLGERAGPRSLPMIGGAPARGPASILRALLLVPDRASPIDARPSDLWPALTPWMHFASRRVEEGYSTWRAELERGLDEGLAGRGTWDAAAPSSPPGAPATAALLGAFSHGLLGLAPDAPSGRIGIAPALPGHVTSFTADGIRVGDVRITLRYERAGEMHRFVLAPTAGSLPALAVFEPSIPARRLDGVRVDGRAADLDALPEGNRTRLRVQIPLDSVRVVEATGRSDDALADQPFTT